MTTEIPKAAFKLPLHNTVAVLPITAEACGWIDHERCDDALETDRYVIVQCTPRGTFDQVVGYLDASFVRNIIA